NLVVVGARLRSMARDRRARALGALAVALVAVGSLVNVGGPLIVRFRDIRTVGLFNTLTDMSYFPAYATDFLAANPFPARLYSLYTWGGFALFRAAGWKVFIDARGHSVYPQELYVEQWIGERGQLGWKEMLDRHQIDLVLWPTESTMYGGKTVL